MSNNNALFPRIKEELFSAVIGDVMDKMGYTQQFFPPYLTTLRRDMVIAGRAMTVLEADVFEEVSSESANPIMAKPFGLMFEALDSLKPNDVYVCTGSSPDYALWGGLMSTRAIKLGAAGAILDGYIRDSNEILSLDFPIASRGCYAQDQGPRGKVINYNVPLRVGQVQIQPGDIIFGDCDGVLCIPKEIEDEVISKALEKVRGESEVRKALENGMSTVEAFERFGIM
ncbi:putative Demethylmenaquinone methyltransferase [Vibrio nigripulchritudo SOn1]|uniref:Putative 4-hydroxy-4-methyl-2-oxoglutarate aldolase n=1 Tax=Vibrio nigripulchritudo SOn1 TaxID=1238450 RepID=A0AAV2VXV5_9VIBR|nr:RraA family protein [Vibrio nigripulchritudo]CCO49230.1 putative Demethylmenaquinone methyltransferase [Vibrio nigripulchritudo SOn1]